MEKDRTKKNNGKTRYCHVCGKVLEKGSKHFREQHKKSAPHKVKGE